MTAPNTPTPRPAHADERDALMARTVPHFVSATCRGERCGPCYRAGRRVDATHKVGEEFAYDAPGEFPRHNLTQYVCCEHYALIMGRLAAEGCGVTLDRVDGEPVAALSPEGERERPSGDQVLAWLGYWRDRMPADAVSSLQDILGVARLAPEGERAPAEGEERERVSAVAAALQTAVAELYDRQLAYEDAVPHALRILALRAPDTERERHEALEDAARIADGCAAVADHDRRTERAEAMRDIARAIRSLASPSGEPLRQDGSSVRQEPSGEPREPGAPDAERERQIRDMAREILAHAEQTGRWTTAPLRRSRET